MSTTNETFLNKLVEQARAGNPKPLNRFFEQLMEKCRQPLIRITQNEEVAREVFAQCIAQFWEKYVTNAGQLTINNIEGFIFIMARNRVFKDQGVKSKSLTTYTDTFVDVGETPNREEDLKEEERQDMLKRKAFEIGLKQLKDNCKRLLEFILETNKESPRDLWEPLGYKNAHVAAQTKSNCIKHLKKLAAKALFQLINSKESGHGNQ